MHDMILWVGMVYVSDIWLVHGKLGKTRTFHNFDTRFGWISI